MPVTIPPTMPAMAVSAPLRAANNCACSCTDRSTPARASNKGTCNRTGPCADRCTPHDTPGPVAMAGRQAKDQYARNSNG